MSSPVLDVSARKTVAYQLLIDGIWCDGSSVIERRSPAHDMLVSRYQAADVALVDRAVAAARRAFEQGTWRWMSGKDRASVLHRAASLIEQRAEEIALLDTLEAGKPIAQVRGEIAGAIDIWRYAASLARTLHGDSYDTLGQGTLGVVLREPFGVVALITPWNFPFLIVSQKLPFALAAGCTVVVKPSELTSASTLVLGEILTEAGLPAGVVNILVGTGRDVGAPMVAHPDVDMVSFTGSTAVGRATMAGASNSLKKVSLELGGKNPQIVFPDADLDAVVDAVVFGANFNAGECCNAGSRLIVHESIADDVVRLVAELSKRVKVGDPLDPTTQVGAIITADHLAKIERHVSRALAEGAKMALQGGRASFSSNQFLTPMILTGVTPGMPIAREEVFGPVLSVLTFRAIDEAIAIANGVGYGLSAAVWSRDIDNCTTVARRVRAGTVWVNSFMDGASELPFGGVGQSGLGRELGRAAVEDYTETKTLNIHTGPRTGWWIPRE